MAGKSLTEHDDHHNEHHDAVKKFLNLHAHHSKYREFFKVECYNCFGFIVRNLLLNSVLGCIVL